VRQVEHPGDAEDQGEADREHGVDRSGHGAEYKNFQQSRLLE
jgi:hypothetical protein